MNGLRAIESSDNIYRDTFRGVFLCSLGRIAVTLENDEAARAHFLQCTQHLRGRSRARAAGHPMVQAVAGLAAMDSDDARFDEALDHFIFLGEDHVRRVCQEYVEFYNRARPSQATGKIPNPYPELEVPPTEEATRVAALPVLGRLQHDYRAAA